MSDPIRVLVADDHDVVRRGLASFIQTFPQFELVGEAANGREAIQLAADLKPDIILMDILMPEVDGIEAIKRIKATQPGIAILALTSMQDEETVSAALKAGATSYILKNAPLKDMVSAINATMQGRRVISPEATEALIRMSSNPVPQYTLTEREREVLGFLVKGQTNQEIADTLIVSRSTVKFHIASIFAKLGVTNRTEAVALALHHHLVE
jgi:two-component system, NarL family, response regulator LiaR